MMSNDGRDPASVAAGHQIAAFLTANASQLGVDYLVWRQHIWHPGAAWRLMDDRGNWTDNHMNHIHVLVHGGFQAGNDIVLPADLPVAGDQLPDGEALRARHEQRVAVQATLDRAKARLAAAEKVGRRLHAKNSARSRELADARTRVGQSVRETYILGIDSTLLSSSVLLLEGGASDPTTGLALERQLRIERETLEHALNALSEAARELSDNEEDLSQAREQVRAAERELASLDAG
jgi:hypothetical protein